MKYETIRQKIKVVIEGTLFNTLLGIPEWKGLDYDAIINKISKETGARKDTVADIIQQYIEDGDLKEERFLFLDSDKRKKLLVSKGIVNKEFDKQIGELTNHE